MFIIGESLQWEGPPWPLWGPHPFVTFRGSEEPGAGSLEKWSLWNGRVEICSVCAYYYVCVCTRAVRGVCEGTQVCVCPCGVCVFCV